MSLELACKFNNQLESVCESIFQEFADGVKSCAISSSGYLGAQQKLIIAMAIFLERKGHKKIGIVTNSFDSSFIKPFVSHSKEVILESSNLKLLNFENQFYFITYDDLIRLKNSDSKFDVSELYKNIKMDFDALLWDLPSVEYLKQNLQDYYGVLKIIDSISIVAMYGKSKTRDIQEIRSFFSCHGISLNGLFLNTTENINNNKKWWELL